MIHRLTFTAITAILSFTCSLSADAQKKWFVDHNFVYEQGHALSQEYLHKNAPKFQRVQEQALPWLVRIEVRHSFNKKDYSSNHGTGIILKNGLVITAYHVFTKNIPTGKTKIQILLTTVEGQVLPATLFKRGLRDWALLKIDLENQVSQQRIESPFVMADPIPGETAIILGYPARLGIDKQGKVQSFHKGDQKKGIPTSQLLPMTVVASVPMTTTNNKSKTMGLKPLAGFPPVGGMSGGPVLNLKGEVIAVQHGIAKTTENATGRILYYRIDATSSKYLPKQ